jgi:hypothetical protein
LSCSMLITLQTTSYMFRDFSLIRSSTASYGQVSSSHVLLQAKTENWPLLSNPV